MDGWMGDGYLDGGLKVAGTKVRKGREGGVGGDEGWEGEGGEGRCGSDTRPWYVTGRYGVTAAFSGPVLDTHQSVRVHGEEFVDISLSWCYLCWGTYKENSPYACINEKSPSWYLNRSNHDLHACRIRCIPSQKTFPSAYR